MKIGSLIREDGVGAWHEVNEVEVPCTLRILREAHSGNDAARLLFLEEVRRVQTLNHPALLRVLKADLNAARPWMLTEPITGRSLDEVVAQDGPLDPASARALAGHVLEGLGYLERRRQVHAYPIPSRVVQTAGIWKLLTFRDIRAWDELKSLKGKKHPQAAFAPPERDKGASASYGPLGHNSWHIGALLRFALGGGTPRTEDGALRPLTSATASELATAAQRLTASAPELRPHGTPGVLRALDGSTGEAQPQPDKPRAPTKGAGAPRLRRRRRSR